MELPLTIDLVTQRFVYPADLGVGVRQLQILQQVNGVLVQVSGALNNGIPARDDAAYGEALRGFLEARFPFPCKYEHAQIDITPKK